MIGNFSVGKKVMCFNVDMYQVKRRAKEHLEKLSKARMNPLAKK